MYAPSARYYDAIYAAIGKDYAAEALHVAALAAHYKRSAGNTLLDVACGTGSHLAHLREHFQAEGLDLEPALLDVARAKAPGVPLHQGDMLTFDLGRQFDLVVCLFSAIGYMRTVERLRQAMRNMARHLRPGGLLIMEPWLRPEDYSEGFIHAAFVDQPDLKIARMNVSRIIEGNISILDFQYLVATPAGVEHFTEHHELGLFSHKEYWSAVTDAGLEPIYTEAGLAGRGLYLGVQPLD